MVIVYKVCRSNIPINREEVDIEEGTVIKIMNLFKVWYGPVGRGASGAVCIGKLM